MKFDTGIDDTGIDDTGTYDTDISDTGTAGLIHQVLYAACMFGLCNGRLCVYGWGGGCDLEAWVVIGG